MFKGVQFVYLKKPGGRKRESLPEPVDNNNVTGGGLWSAFWNSLLGGSLQLYIFWVNINYFVLQTFTITAAWTVNTLRPTVSVCRGYSPASGPLF